MITDKKLPKKEITDELWRRGELSWLMHDIQKEMYQIYINSKPRSTQVWLLSRQTGKSWCLAFIALMEAIKQPDSIVKLLTDTKVHCQSVFEPIFKAILETCPKDVAPEYNSSKWTYFFPNGSQIQMAGTDSGHAQRLRGQKARVVLIDEAGFCDNLEYNYRSILFPTTTHTKGRTVMASTPPVEPDHQFIQFVERAEEKGLLTKKTLFDNPLLTEEEKQQIIDEFPGGTNNTQFRREYLCEFIRDEDKTVIPEFDEELIAKIVKPYVKPPHYHTYVAMDLGFKDLTVALFGYYDFKNDKIIIEDEIIKKGKDLKLPLFSQEIIEKEEELWTNPYTNEVIYPEVRVSDIDLIAIQEINRSSRGQLNFQPITKEPNYKLPLINKIRVMLQSGKIIINPKCENLIRHLKNARWKDASSKDKFARSPDDGHYDAVDALIYLIKSISYSKNPYPSNYNVNSNTYLPPAYVNSRQTNVDIYKSIFGKKSKIK
jgi:PBSX family phage terminase large subunit